MRTSCKLHGAVLCGIVASLILMNPSGNTAQARSTYQKKFLAEYKKLEKKAKEAKCNVCHHGKSKKSYNDYGKTMKDLFGKEKNVKDEKKIKEVLKKAEEKESSVKEKTYGDLIKAGELPGKVKAKR